MRQYIITEREREEIKRYFEDTKATALICVLRVRAKKYLTSLKKDIEFLEKLLGDDKK